MPRDLRFTHISGNLIEANAYIKNGKKWSESNNINFLNFYQMQWTKKNKLNQKEGINKNWSRNLCKRQQKNIKKINKTKRWFFERSTKLTKHYSWTDPQIQNNCFRSLSWVLCKNWQAESQFRMELQETHTTQTNLGK